MNTPSSPIQRLLLVEDDVQLGSGLQIGLEKNGYRTDWVTDARSAYAGLLSTTYDLVLLDLQLPDVSGLTLLSRLRAQGNDILVLVVTARDRVEDRIGGLDSGADDYLVKPFDTQELLARVRALLRRRYGGGAKNLQAGDLVINPAAHTAHAAGKSIDIPHHEYSLLVLLLEQRGRVVTRRRIEAALYPAGSEVESNTIEVYIHNLRKRVGHDVIRTVRGVGYVIDDDDI